MVESIFLEGRCGLKRKINSGRIAGGAGIWTLLLLTLIHATMVWRSRFVFLLLGELHLLVMFTLSAMIFLLPS